MAIWIFVPVYFFSSDEKCRIIFYRSLANIDFLLSLVFLGVIKLNLQCTTTQYYPFHVKTLSFFLLHNKAAFVFCILGSRSFASYCPARVGSRVSFFKLSRDFHMQQGLYFAKKSLLCKISNFAELDALKIILIGREKNVYTVYKIRASTLAFLL